MYKNNRFIRSSFLCISAFGLMLAGCSTSSNDQQINNETIGQPETETRADTGMSDAGDTGVNTAMSCIDNAELETRFIQLINEARATARSCRTDGPIFPAAPAVTWDERLEAAALGHSQDMANNNIFSHMGTSGSDVGIRVSEQNYQWRVVAENIAAGYQTPSETVDAWLNSEGHCINIMDARLEHMGVSCWDNDSSQFKRYWTQNLATPR